MSVRITFSQAEAKDIRELLTEKLLDPAFRIVDDEKMRRLLVARNRLDKAIERNGNHERQ